MGDLSLSRQFLEKYMAAVDRQNADQMAFPPTRPLEPDTASGDVRAGLATLSERSHQMEQRLERLAAGQALTQQGIAQLLTAKAVAESTDNQVDHRLERLDADAQERDKRLNGLERWRYGIRATAAALVALAATLSAIVPLIVDYVRR